MDGAEWVSSLGSEWISRLLPITPEAARREFWRRLRDDRRTMAERGRKRAALRVFLQGYRKFEPEVLNELAAMGADSPPIVGGLERHCAFAERFYLPPTIDLAFECLATREAWRHLELPRDRWHFETPRGRSLAFPYFSARRYEFTFRARGWDLQAESHDDARERIRAEFEAELEAHLATWQTIEQAHSEQRAFAKAEGRKRTARNLLWLAEKQATGAAFSTIARRERCSEDAVRCGIHSAARVVGLPFGALRQAPAGRRRKTPSPK